MSSFLSLQEPVEAGQTAEPAAAAAAAAAGSKVGLEVTNEEPEPAQDIEMPPPMAIQGHSFKASPEAPAAPADDAVTKLVRPFRLDWWLCSPPFFLSLTKEEMDLIESFGKLFVGTGWHGSTLVSFLTSDYWMTVDCLKVASLAVTLAIGSRVISFQHIEHCWADWLFLLF